MVDIWMRIFTQRLHNEPCTALKPLLVCLLFAVSCFLFAVVFCCHLFHCVFNRSWQKDWPSPHKVCCSFPTIEQKKHSNTVTRLAQKAEHLMQPHNTSPIRMEVRWLLRCLLHKRCMSACVVFALFFCLYWFDLCCGGRSATKTLPSASVTGFVVRSCSCSCSCLFGCRVFVGLTVWRVCLNSKRMVSSTIIFLAIRAW